MCKNNIFASSFIGLIRQWHSCYTDYTINCSHLWPFDLYLSVCHGERPVHLHHRSGVHLHQNLWSYSCINICSESSETAEEASCSCWSCGWTCSFYIIWRRLSWQNYFLCWWIWGTVQLLRASVPPLNFVVSWRTLRWRTALPLSEVHSLVWSFCLALSCLIGLRWLILGIAEEALLVRQQDNMMSHVWNRTIPRLLNVGLCSFHCAWVFIA